MDVNYPGCSVKETSTVGDFSWGVADVLSWLGRATELPGKGSLATALMILREGFRYDRWYILLTPRVLRRYNLSRTTVYRALQVLESSGFIEVYRNRGESPRISIIFHSINLRDSELLKPIPQKETT